MKSNGIRWTAAGSGLVLLGCFLVTRPVNIESPAVGLSEEAMVERQPKRLSQDSRREEATPVRGISTRDLIGKLGSKNPEVRHFALEALIARGDLTELIDAADSDPRLLVTLTEACKRSGSPDTASLLWFVLERVETGEVADLTEAVIGFDDDQLVGVLGYPVDSLGQVGRQVMEDAMSGAGNRTLDAILGRLGDPASSDSKTILGLLKAIRNPGMADRLAEIVESDWSSEVREAAWTALDKIRQEEGRFSYSAEEDQIWSDPGRNAIVVESDWTETR